MSKIKTQTNTADGRLNKLIKPIKTELSGRYVLPKQPPSVLFPTVFELLTFKARKWLLFTTPPYLTSLLRRNPLEFLDETYSAKTRGMGLPYVENFIILPSTVSA